MTDLEAIKKALEGVTPVAWSYQFTEENGEVFIIANELGGLIGAALPWPTEVEEKDFRRVVAYARYIAAVNPVAISELLSTLESLQRENEELASGIKRLSDEEELLAETTGDMVSVMKLAAKLALSETHVNELQKANVAYVDANTALISENERLQAEIDRKSSMPGDHRYWEGRYRDEAAENDKLRETLEPFAKFAGGISELKHRAFLQILVCPEGDDHADNYGPHFIRARQALASTGGEHHADK